MESRSWHWLRTRILGLLTAVPTVLPDGRAIHPTRLGLALFPPTDAPREVS